jgi:single-strand DNA-binding protein
MNESYLSIQGRLVADPELRETKTGIAVAVFRVATTVRRPAPGGGYQDGPTSFFNVSAFRSLGVNASRSLKKGEPVTVYGRLRINQFTRADGSHGTTAEIDAYAVGHDLTYGMTRFAKVSRTQVDENDRMADPVIQGAFEAQAAGDGGAAARPTDAQPRERAEEAPAAAGTGDPETDPYEVVDGPDQPPGGPGRGAGATGPRTESAA